MEVNLGQLKQEQRRISRDEVFKNRTLHHFKTADIRKEMKIQSAQKRTDEYI